MHGRRSCGPPHNFNLDMNTTDQEEFMTMGDMRDNAESIDVADFEDRAEYIDDVSSDEDDNYRVYRSLIAELDTDVPMTTSTKPVHDHMDEILKLADNTFHPTQSYMETQGQTYNEILHARGAVVIPVLGPSTREMYVKFISEIKWPEYQTDARERNGVHTSASSFHHQQLQALRRIIKEEVMEQNVFTPSYANNYLTETYDVLEYSMGEDDEKTEEMWYRPTCVVDGEVVKTALFFGGWTNLTTSDRYVVFVPGSHTDPDADPTGSVDPSTYASFRGDLDAVRVPPGHAVIFHHGLLISEFPHGLFEEDSPSKPQPGFILHFGFYIRSDPTVVPGFEVEEFTRGLDVPRITNGSIPRMHRPMLVPIVKNQLIEDAKKEMNLNPGSFPMDPNTGVSWGLRSDAYFGENLDEYEPTKQDMSAMYPELLS